MNTPEITTSRLRLRRFTPEDLPAFMEIMGDETANEFLPWFPPKTPDEAKVFLGKSFLDTYERPQGFRYAICLKNDGIPIGYVNLSSGESNDFGYGLRSEFWHRGIVSEACMAVVEEIRKAGVPFITATHDVNNPRSGNVMKKLGMKYCYSYREQWQPKNIPVVFRMYQLNFDGDDGRVYQKYREMYPCNFIEENV